MTRGCIRDWEPGAKEKGRKGRMNAAEGILGNGGEEGWDGADEGHERDEKQKGMDSEHGLNWQTCAGLLF